MNRFDMDYGTAPLGDRYEHCYLRALEDDEPKEWVQLMRTLRGENGEDARDYARYVIEYSSNGNRALHSASCDALLGLRGRERAMRELQHILFCAETMPFGAARVFDRYKLFASEI
jgi:hypothetical protein